MGNFFKKKISLISFLFIPIVYFWDPNWLGFFGVQPYWPLFWLLPWSMIYGSIDGLIVGLSLGLMLDSITPVSSLSQFPGLALCGFFFGKLSFSSNLFVAHFRYGLVCAVASFLCGLLLFSQILVKHASLNEIFMYYPSIRNIFAEVFITGLLAPFFCSLISDLFKRSKGRYRIFNFKKN